VTDILYLYIGGPSAPQHDEPGGWLSLSKSWKPFTHSMK